LREDFARVSWLLLKMTSTLEVFLGCQSFVVLFIALHDWVPLGKLNNLAGVRAVDTTTRQRFVHTRAFLPTIHGMRPDRLHVCFQLRRS